MDPLILIALAIILSGATITLALAHVVRAILDISTRR